MPDMSYEEWLEHTCRTGTQNDEDWYNCPEEESGQWFEDHPGYFETDPKTGDSVDP